MSDVSITPLDSPNKPTGTIADIFRRCHEHTPYPPAGDYAGSFDCVGDSLETVINCPKCWNQWVVKFPNLDMLTRYASHFGHVISFSETAEISWVLTCPRCVMHANDYAAIYADYLQSPHWQATREAALERAERRCQVCNRTGALQVHHRSYVNKGNEQPGDLTVLCADCHRVFHENGRLAS